MDVLLIIFEVEHNLLKLFHPRAEQMAVLEHDPVSILASLLDVFLSDRTLSLTKGNGNKSILILLLLGKLLQLTRWISSCAQHEDQWHGIVDVLIDHAH
jgi:hypothetical protein